VDANLAVLLKLIAPTALGEFLSQKFLQPDCRIVSCMLDIVEKYVRAPARTQVTPHIKLLALMFCFKSVSSRGTFLFLRSFQAFHSRSDALQHPMRFAALKIDNINVFSTRNCNCVMSLMASSKSVAKRHPLPSLLAQICSLWLRKEPGEKEQ
jgi:hypothetical protein